MMTSHPPRDVPGADADGGTTAQAAGLWPGRPLIAVMLLAAVALDLARCGIVPATARHAGPAIGLVSAGLAAAALSLWTAHGCQGGQRRACWAALLIGAASAPQAAAAGFHAAYAIPDTTTAGGITAATASTSPASGAPSPSHSAAAVTVHTAQAVVGGKTETILTNATGQPLYYYQPDTATKSLVTGSLAALWPPLTAGAPTGTGLGGQLAVLKDVNGQQVTYNGHPLYTFADDHTGQVSGQGFQDFSRPVTSPVSHPLAAPVTGSPPSEPQARDSSQMRRTVFPSRPVPPADRS